LNDTRPRARGKKDPGFLAEPALDVHHDRWNVGMPKYTLKKLVRLPLFRYTAAVAAIGLAFLLRVLLSFIAGPDFPEYLVFYPTVMIVALLAGVWPAILATAVSAVFVALWILPQPPVVSSGRTANYVGLGLFVLVCTFLAVVAELYRRSRQKAAAYDKEQALRESQETLRQQAELLKLSFDAIFVRQMEGGIESWNRGAEELYGYTEEQAVGRAPAELLATGGTLPAADIVAALREHGHWEGELRHRTREGRVVIVSSRQHVGRGFDGRERVLEIDRDITDRKHVQEQLQKAHDQLEEKVQQRTIDLQRANRMLLMVSMCDQALVQISDELELMQVICQIIQDEGGYPLVWVGLAEQDAARSVRRVASVGDRDGFLDGVRVSWGAEGKDEDPMGRAIRTGAPVLSENLSRLPAGTPWKHDALRRGFRSMASLPLMSGQSTAFGALVIYADKMPGFDGGQMGLLKELVDDLAFGIMSLRARAERDSAQRALETKASQLQMLAAELVRSEERERKRIAQLLHDQLQQMLAAALYGLEGFRGPRREAAVRENIASMSELLKESMRISRSLTSELSHPALSEPDLREALTWIAGWMKEKYGLAVELKVSRAVILEAEEMRITLLQAVRELLFNVVKHAGVKSARLTLSTTPDGRAVISVSDKGAGFDAGRISPMDGGTGGIGLFRIRERLALAGGGLEFQSTPGRGSRFTVWVPAQQGGRRRKLPPPPSPAPPASPPRPAGRARAAGERIRVLLVDDHMVVRNGLALQLREQPDIEVVGEAADGASAIALVRVLAPDVVTMDINMPGMNGVEATRTIHTDFPGVRILGLSMFEQSEQAAAMRAAGAAEYFSKSASFDSLLAAIRAGAPRGRPRARTRARAGAGR
jgi:PAS domain S-box-containing protein